MSDLLPRLKMQGAVVVKTLDKFEKAGFVEVSDLGLKPEEFKDLARETRYPLEVLLKERGMSMDGSDS